MYSPQLFWKPLPKSINYFLTNVINIPKFFLHARNFPSKQIWDLTNSFIKIIGLLVLKTQWLYYFCQLIFINVFQILKWKIFMIYKGENCANSILSNTLGEQYSRKNSKRIQIVIIFNVVHPGQSRECFDDVVKEMPEMENDINELFCWSSLKKLIVQIFLQIINSKWGHNIFGSGRFLFCRQFPLDGFQSLIWAWTFSGPSMLLWSRLLFRWFLSWIQFHAFCPEHYLLKLCLVVADNIFPDHAVEVLLQAIGLDHFSFLQHQHFYFLLVSNQDHNHGPEKQNIPNYWRMSCLFPHLHLH